MQRRFFFNGPEFSETSFRTPNRSYQKD